jgi:hypothetical protein
VCVRYQACREFKINIQTYPLPLTELNDVWLAPRKSGQCFKSQNHNDQTKNNFDSDELVPIIPTNINSS